MQSEIVRRSFVRLAPWLCAACAIAIVCPPLRAAEKRAGVLSEREARDEAESTITQEALKTYLSFIASDEMEGRDTPSRGLDTTAKFIATELTRWGFTPMGGDGTFFQKISLHSLFLDAPKSTVTLGGKTLRYSADFLIDDASETHFAVAQPSPLVFVGEGWYVRNKGIDAYRGIDVHGKIVVIASPTAYPPGVTAADLPRAGRGTNWMSPDAYAVHCGAAGIIHLPDSNDPMMWSFKRRDASSIRLLSMMPIDPKVDTATNSALPTLTLSPDVAATLFQGEALSLDAATAAAKSDPQAAPFAFDAAKAVTMNLAAHVDVQTTQNVVAAWEGSDPVRREQYVALGAHYDHLGIAAEPNANGDRIYNGADDDGSGTTALLTFAEALSHEPSRRPKRTLLFVWHCGEEKGLWGSSYFTNNPTVPIGQIVAQLNIDMIGRGRHPGDTNARNAALSDENTIYVIGSRMLSHELGDIAQTVNRSYDNLRFDYRYDDPNDPNRFYYRSDHYNYAKHNIPIIFYFDGVHEDYHRVTDEVSKIDFPKYETVARTIFLTAIAVADRDNPPALDKK